MEMDFGDELPCGGYADEDNKIKHNMNILSNQNADGQKLESIAEDCNCNCTSNQNNNKCSQSCSCSKTLKDCCKQGKCLCKKGKDAVQAQKIVPMRNVTKEAKCKKCKVNPAALIHKTDPICKQCLLMNIEYKCRLTMQNSMKVKGDSSILLCFSGGINSICLTKIMASLKSRYQKHHLFGTLKCIHIQQQDSLPDNYKAKFQKQTGLQLQIINIAQVFEEQGKSLNDVRSLFKMFGKGSNTEDFLILLRDHLIAQYAKKNKFDFIIKGLNGQSIAGSIFKYFAKGIGGDVTQLSSREDDSLFHFPLRQHLQKELQYYFYTEKCNTLSMKSEADDLSNIVTDQLDQHLDSFILSLQSLYSHTAPAITRTAQKIQSNRRNDNRCKWCMFKGAFEPYNLCRKCERMYQNKNKNFDQSLIPKWLRIESN